MMRSSRRHRFVDLAVGGASVVALLAIVVAVPVGLVLTIGSPLPRTVPSPDVVAAALRYGQIAPPTLLRGLAVVLWVVWALLVLSLGLEIAAVVRGTVARAVPGLEGFQQLAARLIATVMLLSSVTTRAGAAAPPIPAAVVVHAPATLGMAEPVTASPGSTDGRDTARPEAQPTPSWTVRRHDSLWAIAERTLGDGHRWKEIAALNAERRQPDGRRLGGHSTLIHPGWRLVLPEDAAVDEPPERVVVAPGDDLWGLAERHLGDGERWAELYARNRGRRQPDGGRLTDPDLIRPGWTLRLSERRGPDEDPHRGTRPVERKAARAAPDEGPAPRTTTGPEHHAAQAEGSAMPGVRSRAPRHRADDGGRNGTSTAQPPALPFTPETLPRPSEGAAPLAEGPGVLPMVAEGPDEHSTPPAADTRGGLVVVVGGALLAAGLVGVLTRRRRHWLRRRQLGEQPATIDPAAAELERWLRSMADHDLHQRVDRVLRVLSDHFETHGVAPDITAVELGEDISLRLGAAVTPPRGVSASDDGRRWTLAAELEVASPPVAAERYVPTLVSCGRLPSGSLLQLNPLATAGLGVTGRPEQLQDVMTSWTTELAAGAAARGVDIVVVGPHHPLVERLERVSIVPDVAAAVARLQRAAADVEVSCIVLCGDSHDDELASLLAAADHPRAGVVVFGDEPLATTVMLDGERVVLRPDDTSLEAPTWLTPDDWHRFGDLLHPSGQRHGVEPASSPLLSVVGDELEPLDDPAPDQPLVGVLGPLEIAGRAPRLGAGAAQLLTYLAVHRTGGDAATLQQLVWPRQAPNDERLTSAIAAIEETFDGADTVVVRTDDGRIELSDTVASDLGRCEELARGLDHRPAPLQARLLYHALDLVRGEPFTGAGAWAHADGTALRAVGLIVDLAHRLAMHALTVGDVERASWAVERGLRAAPMNELLHRDRMRVADACGDTVALDAAMRELRDLTAAEGGWVTVETERCYRHLRGVGDAPLDVEQDAS